MFPNRVYLYYNPSLVGTMLKPHDSPLSCAALLTSAIRHQNRVLSFNSLLIPVPPYESIRKYAIFLRHPNRHFPSTKMPCLSGFQKIGILRNVKTAEVRSVDLPNLFSVCIMHSLTTVFVRHDSAKLEFIRLCTRLIKPFITKPCSLSQMFGSLGKYA